MRALTGSDNRWQGYSHRQLYEMLHSGPGSGAAGTVADRWSNMADALSDIQDEINNGVTASGATWDGTAADSARGALGPLGEWADQASTAADVMRISTELQGDLLAKARADMPAPVSVPQPPSQIGQVVTAQIDYEVAELSSQIAEQQAYQVMAQYEAATNDNTSTLGDFGEPPTLVVDTTPISGPAVRTGVRSTDLVRSSGRSRGASAGAEEESAPRGTGSAAAESRPGSVSRPSSTSRAGLGESTASEAESSTPPAPSVAASTPSSSSGGGSGAGVSSSGVIDSPGPPTTPESVPGVTVDASASGVIGAETGLTPLSTTPSSAGSGSAGSTTPSAADSPVTRTSSDDRRASGDSATFSQGGTGRFSGGAVVPAARRPDDEDDDELHESKYLIEADDIYGAQSYTPPVIGESPRSRR